MMPGDTVTLLDGRNDDNHNTGWMAPMDNLVGKSFVIQEVRTNPSYPEYYEYKLGGDDSGYWYDEAWLSLVTKQPTISDGEISMFLDDL